MSGFYTDVGDHGRKQFELKNHYPLTSNKTDRYVVDTWIYVPASLMINKGEQSVTRFLSNVKSLTRFSAPCIPLSRLIDEQCDISPLMRIRNELTSADLGKDIRSKKIIYELRSLANLYNSEITTSEAVISDAVKNGRLAVVKDSIKQNLKDIRAFLDVWRELYGLFLASNVDSSLREAYTWTDQAISITTEHVLFELQRQINPDDEAPSLTKRIRKLMDDELSHRKAMGYQIASDDIAGIDVERRIYWDNTLKKWAQSVLYLTQEESGTSRRIGHVLAGVAAAIAMSFAVLATFLAERLFPGQGLPWAIVIIVAYIFKDRIKEVLRNILIHTIPGVISDDKVHLIDQATGRKVGKVKSRVKFYKSRNAPVDIANLRAEGGFRFQQILPDEDLVHFRREIVIRNSLLRDSHTRLDTLSDIVRFKLGDILVDMDDPKKTIPTFASEVPTELSGNRVYHINLIVRLTSKTGRAKYSSRYRLVVNRSGLLRIEFVAGNH